MTVARDAVLEFATFTTTSPATLSFTPTGTPRGVTVWIALSGGFADTITAVTYGGVSMARIGYSVDTVTEQGIIHCYFLGAGIPTGTQTVEIVHTGDPLTKWAVVQSVTAASDTDVSNLMLWHMSSSDHANPFLTLDTGVQSALRTGIIFSGHDDISSLTPLSGMEAITTADSHDFGTAVAALAQQTTASTGPFNLGFTATAEDMAMLAVSIRESAVDAFPDTTAAALSWWDNSPTSHLVQMPYVVDSGDLLIVGFSVQSSTVTTPGGWTLFNTATNGSITTRSYYKIADGTEAGTTVDFVTNISIAGSAYVLRFTNWHGTTPPEAGTAAGGTSANPDPPSLSPSWGAEDTMWLTVATHGFGTSGNDGYPTNYSNFTFVYGLATSTTSTLLARRKNNTATENPGTFTLGASIAWVAQTIAVRPSSGPPPVTGTIASTQDPNVAAFSGTVTSNAATGTLASTQQNQTASFAGTVVNPVPSSVTVNGQTVTIHGNQGTVTILDSLLNVVYSGGAAVITLPPGDYTWTSTDGPSGSFSVSQAQNRMGGTGAIRKPPRSLTSR